ncbi:MAG TPA: hypothetical protein VF519_17175 [Mycobacteriales bacterium]|jgi:hypothetical protein
MRVVGVVRARLPWLVGALALSVLAADSAVLAAREAPPLGMPYSVALEQHVVTEHPAETAERERERDDAIEALFDRRAAAVTKRDRAAFLADLDDTDEEFVRRQGEVFDSLGKLEFTSWEYRLRDETYSLANVDWERYKRFDDIALPVLTLHYQLKGYDTQPVVRRVVYTVVRDGKAWRIANDRDLQDATTSGTSVRVDPWENGPITVAKSKNGLVIGHPDDADAIAGIQKEVEDAVRHVSSFVGKAWGEKTVVILPANHEELEYVLENPDVPFEFAAIAHPEFTTLDEEFGGQFAGTRVVINPDNFDADSPFNRQLIRHELTHVALFRRTGPLSPRWLVEGIAEWVGNAGLTQPTPVLAPSFAEQVEEDGPPSYLPLDSDFGFIGEAGVGYDAGWLLCRYIAMRWGNKALLRFYDEMGNRKFLSTPGDKLDRSLREVLHTDAAALLKAWRPYVRAIVGDVHDLVAAPPKPYKDTGVDTLDASVLGRLHDVKPDELKSAGMERAAQGVWYQGDEDAPARLVTTAAAVSRDDAGARRVAGLLERELRKYDSGVAIPNGRLFIVQVTISDKEYVDAVAIVTAGIVTYSVAVSYELYSGDPRPEARRLAAAQVKAALA